MPNTCFSPPLMQKHRKAESVARAEGVTETGGGGDRLEDADGEGVADRPSLGDPCSEHFWDMVNKFSWIPTAFYALSLEFFSGQKGAKGDAPWFRSYSGVGYKQGASHYLRRFKCRLETLEESRGLAKEDTSFVGVLALMISQAGQAMYAVLAMFLALVPAVRIILHVVHFFVDRLLDVLAARTNWDTLLRTSFFTMQVVSIYFVSRFLFTAIFLPIFSMQATIATKLLFSVWSF